ncbi:hypothetical protein KC19_11G058200 [Ceratodon purpureus]|uniref:Alpha-carbonic anhydrase domain-containing protein n=1 Tax=Ceratodon purpureus TaxID=3225 RepID=A0A8T0GF96_CERPU|nr:hypothetical protein KC19_11G058200 [Ceratodon purpureus]
MYFKMSIAAQLGAVLLLLWLHYSSVSCQAVPAKPVKVYDYSNGPYGPANWGNFPGWEKCKTGSQQSPINVTRDVVVRIPLDVAYKWEPVASDIYNDGHTPTVEVLVKNAGVVTISGVKYELVDFHFHTPSEHRILGQSFSMEQHLVHKSADGKIAVIALFYNLGPLASKFLAQFFDKLPPYTPPYVRTPINIQLPLLQHNSYYRYDGSLTTPPCDEGVVWIVLDQISSLSSDQLQKLKASKPEDNARPLQARNGRKVTYSTK